MFFLPFSAKHALYQLRDVTQYILALGGLAVSNPGYVVFIIYGVTLKALAAIQVSLMWRRLAIHLSLTVVNQSLPLVIVVLPSQIVQMMKV